jgi:ESCRT-II complex subunit VPS22
MHRLGGVGIAAFERQQESHRSFAQLSTALSETQLAHLRSQLAQFRTALTGFAASHRDSIRNDPAFRHRFTKMCSSIGVDPLGGPRDGGWWAELLGLGDWQCELGVQIVDVCVSTRPRNGGLIEMEELVRLVGKLRGLQGGIVTESDVVRSIKTLEPLGAGYEVIDIAGRKMVRSVVKQLDEDQAVVLALARETGGRIEENTLVRQRNWTRERARAALDNMLLRDGLCWLDEQDEQCGKVYWVISAVDWGE